MDTNEYRDLISDEIERLQSQISELAQRHEFPKMYSLVIVCSYIALSTPEPKIGISLMAQRMLEELGLLRAINGERDTAIFRDVNRLLEQMQVPGFPKPPPQPKPPGGKTGNVVQFSSAVRSSPSK